MDPYQKQDFGIQGGPAGMPMIDQGYGGQPMMDQSYGGQPMMDQGYGAPMPPQQQPPPQPAMGPASRALAREEANIARLKGDTYKERRRMGRPKHSMGSIGTVIVAIFCWLLQAVAIAMPGWRTSYNGMLGYPAFRSWGILNIKGMRTQSMYQQAYDTCGYYAELNVGGVCASPICVYYRVKCWTYTDMMIYSYCIAVAMFIAQFIHMLCIIWTVKFTCKTIKWAALWWPVVSFLDIAGGVTWLVMSEITFDTLNVSSVYPTPSPSYCAVASAIAMVGLCICTWLGCFQWRRWPNPDDEDFESTTDENYDSGEECSSDSTETKRKKKKKNYKKKQPQEAKQGHAEVDNSLMDAQLAAATQQGGQPDYGYPQGGQPDYGYGAMPPQPGMMGPPPQ
jgi:hypothetical protein